MKIAVLEPVTIGHSRQWVLQRSDDTRNPVILFVHGGPGTSQLSINRHYTRPLERHFTVVNWDQRGAGKSYRAIADAGRMNLAQIVDDTVELTRHLLGKLGHERVLLAGHSWGTVVGTLTVARHPELFHGYVGIGQVANMRENEIASWAWTLEQARARGHRSAVAALESMGPPPYSGDWQRKTLTQRSGSTGSWSRECGRSRSRRSRPPCRDRRPRAARSVLPCRHAVRGGRERGGP